MWSAIGLGTVLGIASIPHCLWMCGPLVTTSCSKNPSAWLRYESARLISYTLLGVLAGLGGQTLLGLVRSVWWTALISWFVSVGFLLAGFRWWLRRTRPKSSLELVEISPKPKWTWLWSKVGTFVLGKPGLMGGLTAFLPCGTLVGALAAAANMGSIGTGSVLMMSFALVSAVGPMLLGVPTLHLKSKLDLTQPRWVAVAFWTLGLFFLLRPVSSLVSKGNSTACHAEHHVTS